MNLDIDRFTLHFILKNGARFIEWGKERFSNDVVGPDINACDRLGPIDDAPKKATAIGRSCGPLGQETDLIIAEYLERICPNLYPVSGYPMITERRPCTATNRRGPTESVVNAS